MKSVVVCLLLCALAVPAIGQPYIPPEPILDSLYIENGKLIVIARHNTGFALSTTGPVIRYTKTTYAVKDGAIILESKVEGKRLRGRCKCAPDSIGWEDGTRTRK